MTKRLYVVEHKKGGLPDLVSATSGAAAVRHIARDSFVAHPARPTEVADILLAGGKVQVAGDEVETSPQTNLLPA
jgi:hypothetical protein